MPEMTLQPPSVCGIVIYQLTDAEKAGLVGAEYPMLLLNGGLSECPAVVCAVHSDACVSLKLLPNGGDSAPHRSSVMHGTGPGQWRWPTQVVPKITAPSDPKY